MRKRAKRQPRWSEARKAEAAELRAMREEARDQVAEVAGEALHAGLRVRGEALTTFIDRVDEWLAVKGWKMVEFGAQLGYSHAQRSSRSGFWSQFKRYHQQNPNWSPTAKRISRIAIALGAPLPDLLEPFNDLGKKRPSKKAPKDRATRPAPRGR